MEPEGTRERILQAAMRLFAARGFRATTVGDIEAEQAAAAWVLYRHFASKEAVFEACLERWIADVKGFLPRSKPCCRSTTYDPS